MRYLSDKLGIYIHVPFCKRKCPYCNFYSLSNKNELIDKYVHKVCKEIKKWSKIIDKKVNSIYFGGGTPSLIDSKKIILILESVKRNFNLSFPEITLEVNPADYEYLDFEMLRYNGVNRISIGAQVLKDKDLKILGSKRYFKNVRICCEIWNK